MPQECYNDFCFSYHLKWGLTNSFITLTHVEKVYTQPPALKDINITIEKGEFFVLVGPPGSGKSTLLRLIAGLDKMSG